MKISYTLWKRLLLSVIVLTCISLNLKAQTPNAWINELHYDDSSPTPPGDANEVVEIVIENAESYNITLFLLELYNGASSVRAPYDTKTLNLFTEGSTIGDFTIYYYTYPNNTVQNGAPDGLALSYNGSLIPNQFLSYEGTFTALSGVAAGLTSVDIGVSESNSTPVGYSLQLSGYGSQYSNFTWQAPADDTPGALNNGQTFPISLVSNPSNFDALVNSTTQIDLSWSLNSNGDSVLVAYNSSNTFGTPAGVYSIGSPISGGGTIIYKGTGTSTNHPGLDPNTLYFYKAWSKSNAGIYSEGVYDSAYTYKIEPSEYPSNFLTQANGITITCAWTDATGTQLPDAYLIKISNADNISAPVDGTPVANDRNVSDGAGAFNVGYGIENFTFYRLQPSTVYYIKIYPYTNAGTGIDYKNDGSVPSGGGTTQMLLTGADMESAGFGTWSTYSAASNRNWEVNTTVGGGAYNTSYYAIMNGFGQDVPSDDWLISPSLNFYNYYNEKINFFWQYRFSTVTDELKLKYSLDYTSGDPTLATWTEIPFTITTDSLVWVNSGFIELSSIAGDNVHFAFQYLGSYAPRRWNVDEIAVTADGVAQPNNFNAESATASQINLSWTMNANNDSVMVAYNTVNSFGTPNDGTHYNVGEIIEGDGTVIYLGDGLSTSHTGLNYNTKYYYQAWSKSADNLYSPSVLDSATTYKNEPSNYPADFVVTGTGITITANWTDAVGESLPDKYLVLISDAYNVTPPTDGTPVVDDINLSDGSGAINVAYGMQIFTFYRLEETTTYYMRIYPYSNSGALIDYKTDGTAPSGNGITQSIINVLDLESVTWEAWDTLSLASTKDWNIFNGTGAFGTTKYANINGFGGTVSSNDWLISPSLNLKPYANTKLVFFTYWNFTGPSDELKVKYSTNYTAGSDPTLATWTELPFTISSTAQTWTPSGFIDLSSINKTSVFIAFHYANASPTATRSWSVDEIEITGSGVSDPTNFNASTSFYDQIDLSWIKNVNNNDVMVAWNTENVFGDPEGPLSEGMDIPGGGYVLYRGPETFYPHTNLEPATEYFYKAWSVDMNDIYSAGVTDNASTLFAEPTNQPTEMTATTNDFSQITVSWTDSDASRYLIKGSSVNYAAIVEPVDMVGESDSALVKNINASVQTAIFSGLMPNTIYYFKIYPYNGTGSAANYKTDGEVPQAYATTSELDSKLIITEVADPADNPNARFVEIMNIGNSTINFATTPYYLSRQANGSGWQNIHLVGSLDPGENYVVAYNSSFITAYGITPNLTNGYITGNGNDGYFLYYWGPQSTGYLVDSYGVIDEDGSGKPWFYEDKKAVRKRTVTSPNTIWTASEWVILTTAGNVEDMTPDFHNGTVTWQGTTSTSWNTRGDNWDSPNGYIPDASCIVTIPAVANSPVITEPSAVHSVEIQTGASLSVQSTGSLQVIGQ